MILSPNVGPIEAFSQNLKFKESFTNLLYFKVNLAATPLEASTYTLNTQNRHPVTFI